MPYRSPAPDARLGLAVVELQRLRCERGEHDVSIVAADRVVYAPGGRQRAVAERYCRCCGERLAAGPEKSPRTGGHRPGADTEEITLNATIPT